MTPLEAQRLVVGAVVRGAPSMPLAAWAEQGGPPMLLESLGIHDPDELARTVAPQVLRQLLDAPEPAPDGEWIDPAHLGAVRPFRERRAARQRVAVREVAPGELPALIAAYEATWEERLLRQLRASSTPKHMAETVARWEAEKARRAEAELARIRRQLAEIDAARAAQGPRGVDVPGRASRYLETVGAACHADLVTACRVLVCGWGLAEAEALEMLEREWAPRAASPVPRRELVRTVRWASRLPGERGYLIGRGKR